MLHFQDHTGDENVINDKTQEIEVRYVVTLLIYTSNNLNLVRGGWKGFTPTHPPTPFPNFSQELL